MEQLIIEPNLKFVGFMITFVVGLFRFSLSIAEAVILEQNREWVSGCHQVWIQVLIMCVVGLVLTTFTLCGASTYFSEEKNSDRCDCRVGLLHLISFGVSIWIQDTHHNISNECRQSYEEHAPTLWKMFFVEFIVFWASIALLVFINMIVFIVYFLLKKCGCLKSNIQPSAIPVETIAENRV